MNFNSFHSTTKSVSAYLLLLSVIFLYTAKLDAELIAYDPFVNANVANGLNSKTTGEYNAGSFFRDFTNGNNNNVAGGQIVGFSAANLWEGNSAASSTYIGPTAIGGLSLGDYPVQGGNVQARAYNTAGGVAYARRMLDAYAPSNTYYMSGLIRCDKFSTNLNIRAMMGFSNTISSGTFDGSVHFPGAIFGFYGDGNKVDLVVRHRDDNAVIQNTALLSNAQIATVYFVVVKIEYDAIGGLERLTAWLNPTAANENNATPAFVTTGQILSTPAQMTYGGFWIENFTSGINDYVQFDEMRLGTEWPDVMGTPAVVQTASEMAVSDYVRPDYAPKYSDVCVSSRWLRGVGYQENAKMWGTLGTPDEKPFESLEVLKMYHATRLEWIYLYGNQVDFIPKVRAQGITVSFAQTNNLADNPGGGGPQRIGRIVDGDGNYLLNWFDNIMGCANNQKFREMFLRESKSRIDAGSTSIQLDDPTLNDNLVCWCEDCGGIKNGFEATTEFYQWLHDELDSHYLQTYGIAKFPVHGNNSSHTRYTESYFGEYDGYRLDYGQSEINVQNVSAQHFHNVALLSRTYQGISRAQSITSPGTWGYSQPVDISDFTKIVRRSVGTSYAQGMNMLAPFDRFAGEPVNAGDQVQVTRFFGNPQNFADMFGFIRGIAIYLDNYEFVWGWGRTPKAIYRDPGTPYSDTWGTSPTLNQPVIAVNDGIAVVIRAVPGDNDEPVAIHLIDWNHNDAFSITLKNEKYFGQSGDDLRLTLLEPLSNYNAADYATTWSNLNYTYYVKSTVLSGSYSGGQTTVAIPKLGPWAVLMVSKGKSTALPLYNSPRWQQLRNEAPSIATPSYPSGNILATPSQSIMLSFDKDVDGATVIADNFIVKHEQSGMEIEGTWIKLGSLLRFTPSSAYIKGTISVQLTQNLKATSGAPCLRQKFYYTCNHNIADTNNDKSVDILDLSAVAAGWLKYTSIGDITGNGYVDYNDIDSFAYNWLQCYVAAAEAVYPADKEQSAATGIHLKWAASSGDYDVYFGDNEADVANAGLGTPEFVANTAANFYYPPALEDSTTYFWRIDTTDGGCTTKGRVNSFTTTSKKTLAYWELDSGGQSAVGSGDLRLILGTLSPSATYSAINNPDVTTPWNGSDSSAANSASIYFDGSTAIVNNVPYSPFQFKRSAPFTCEAYIYPTASTGGSGIIFGTRDGFSSFYGWYLRYDPVNLRLNFYHAHSGGVASSNSANNAAPLNTFSHVAMVWDPSSGANGQIRVYVDGNQVIAVAGQSYWNDAPGCGWNFMVGGRNVPDAPWGFIGMIDEVRWSDYALDPSEFLNSLVQ